MMGEESVQAPPHILNELILKGQNRSFDAMFSKYTKRDFSFSILEATYKQRTHKKMVESDYISFGLTNEQGKLTYVGVLSSDQCPLLQARTFCTRWNGLTTGSILIVSPGGMFSGEKIQELDLWMIPSERRNPVLADLFQRMKLMERRGSGIKNILEIYQGRKAPEFKSTETHFVTTFYNENYQKQYLEAEKEVFGVEKEVLEAEKEVLEVEKEVLEAKKEVFDNLISNMEGNTRTKENADRIIAEFVTGETFARQDVMDVLGITKTPAGKLMQKMLRAGLIIPVPAAGRGKHCINQEI
jgi:Predicted transcriptional regulator containing an HTH domain and an uncharacterized domain shared with the mammalian protein Schlafen